MFNRIFLVAVLAVFSGAACSDQAAKTDFKAEAKALCDAFNPSTWDVDLKKLSPSEKATMLQQKIQSEPTLPACV